MLEIRTNCENCNKSLPVDSSEAMICTFECTFCKTCVDEILYNVCPNCSGGFERRPVRPKKYIDKFPPSDKKILKPVDISLFQGLLEKMRNVDPSKR